MYFTCSTLRTLMTVASCEKSRKEKIATKKKACMECTRWKAETTDTDNLQTIEQVLAPAQISVEKPLPMRFDFRNAGSIEIRSQYRTGPYK